MDRTARTRLVLFIFLLLAALAGGAAFETGRVSAGSPAIAPDSSLAAAPSCGKDRWSVKTGTDPDVTKIDPSHISTTTLDALVALPQPKPLPDNNRIAPVETTVWALTASLTAFGEEDDSDYHLVIEENGKTMIAEIPDPHCVGATSPLVSAIAQARAKFDAQFAGSGASSTFRTIKGGIPVRIVGVGFFDKLHGQRGVAPNGIELHPVLDIEFNPDQAPDTEIPVVSAHEGTSETQWDYEVLAATTAEELTKAMDEHGKEGWELVNVMLDDKRPDRYVGFLKRPH